MNYLAHLYLAGGDDAFLVGNLMGDFVKGRPETRCPPVLAHGVRLHRAVDSFSDSHPVHRRSRRRLSAGRRRIAGIVIDLAYDHFLARHWRRFSDEPLAAFTSRSYTALRAHEPALPERLQRMLPRMAAEDWLRSYLELDNVGFALDRMATRLSRPMPLRGSVVEVRARYPELEADFLEFFPELVAFAADWRSANPIPGPERR